MITLQFVWVLYAIIIIVFSVVELFVAELLYYEIINRKKTYNGVQYGVDPWIAFLFVCTTIILILICLTILGVVSWEGIELFHKEAE